MRKETKLLREILKMEYPESDIHIKFKFATNYVDSSDKLVVSINKAVYPDVFSTLIHSTRNMSIYPKGKGAARSGNCHPQIFDIHAKEFVDVDCCEFIEVDIVD